MATLMIKHFSHKPRRASHVWALLSLALASCGRLELSEQRIDPTFQPYIDTVLSWTTDTQLNDSISSIQFGAMPKERPKALGVCWSPNVYLPRSRQIVINQVTWNKSKEWERLALIAHELGHCQWNWEHLNDPTNIMFPSVINSEVKETFMKAYLSQ